MHPIDVGVVVTRSAPTDDFQTTFSWPGLSLELYRSYIGVSASIEHLS